MLVVPIFVPRPADVNNCGADFGRKLIVVRLGTSWNGTWTVVTPQPIVILVKFVQPTTIFLMDEVTLLGMTKLVRLSQFMNTLVPR